MLQDPVERALRHFERNRALAKHQLADLRRSLEGHEHGFWCFRWRWCRKCELEIERTEGRITAFQEAEDGLRHGNYKPAIFFLDGIATCLYETPWQTARRVTMEGSYTAETILTTPGVLRARVIELRDGLKGLVPTAPEEK